MRDNNVGYDEDCDFKERLVVSTKLNTHLGYNLPWVEMAFHTNIVNLVLVIVNMCESKGLMEMLGTLKDVDKGFEKDNHELEGSW